MHPFLALGPVKLNSYGVLLIFGFIAAVLVAIIRARKYKIPPQRVRKVLHFVVLVLIAGFIGARIFCIFEHLQLFLEHPRELFAIGHGGLSWYGGLLFGFLVGFWCLKKGKFRIGTVLDILAPGIALGFFFGRMGCFLRGCCFGNPTQVPWGVIFPSGAPASIVYWEQVKVHPTQLYASFAGLVSFFILLAIEKRIRLKLQGILFFCFLMLYGLWRFTIEFFRYHDPELYLVGWFTRGHALSIVSIILGLTLIWRTVKRNRQT